MIKISLDVMSTELGHKLPIKAAYKFYKKHKNVKFYFVGLKTQIESFVNKLKFPKQNFEIINASQIILPSDGILSVRKKPDSSMIKAVELVKNDVCDIVISSGSTPVFLAACHFFLKEMKGIERPAIMPLIPNIGGTANIILDVGATLDPKIKDLWKFAHMANVYAKEILHVKNPKIGLINIGEEETKGHELQREVYKKLKSDKELNFYGNIEPRYLFTTKCDILLADGFSGNLVLKTLEGTAQTILGVLKQEFNKNIFTKIRTLVVYSILKKIKKNFNYKKYNGALIIGLNKPAFKTHGSSDEFSWYSVIEMAYENIKNDVLNKIKEEIQNEKRFKYI